MRLFHRRDAFVVFTILAVLALPSCNQASGSDDAETAETQSVRTEPNVVSVTARDYAFEAPDEIPAGWTTFELRNEGQEMHHIQLVRLEDGKTLDDLIAAVQAGGPPPAWMVEVGGPNSPAPGAASSATVELTPGTYGMLCLIPSPTDGVPHIMKGMMKEFTVVPAEGPAATAPQADIVMTLTDYDFQLSEPITPGTHTLQIETSAAQPHEVFFIRLAPDKTVGDVLAWMESPEGPPPGMPIGGVAGIEAGEVNYASVTFEPGEYGLLCFLPDAGDGQPHFTHGMMKQISVE